MKALRTILSACCNLIAHSLRRQGVLSAFEEHVRLALRHFGRYDLIDFVATHPASATPASVGETRQGMVYELFFTALPVGAFTAADVVDL